MHEGNDHSFPDELDILVNGMFIFKVKVSTFNVEHGSKTNIIHKMIDNIKMI